MMSQYLLALSGLLLIGLPGFLVLVAFDHRKRLGILERLALAYGLGLGLLTWQMLFLHFLGLPFGLYSILVPLLVGATAVLLGTSLWPRPQHFSSATVKAGPSESLSQVERLLCAGIVLELATVFPKTLLLPMESYDAVTIWALKAKAFYLFRSIPTDFLLDHEYVTSHADYPLLIPFAESYVYFFVGQFNDFLAKWLFPVSLTVLVAAFYALLRRVGLSRPLQIAFCFMLASIPHFTHNATTGYADILVAHFYGVAFCYLLLWFRDPQLILLQVSALFSGLAGLTKNEGLVLAASNLIVMLFWAATDTPARSLRGRLRYPLAYAAIVLVVLAPWLAFRVGIEVSNDVINQKNILEAMHWNTLSRIPAILYHYQGHIFGFKNWNLLWVLAFGLLAVRFRSLWRSDLRYVVLAVALPLLVYTGTYLVTPYHEAPFDVLWHLRTSASRLLIHVVPVVVFGLACYCLGSGQKPPPLASE
ncbi:MAG: hypothetical protein AB1898_27385 [Acidobacteriota bacterium]